MGACGSHEVIEFTGKINYPKKKQGSTNSNSCSAKSEGDYLLSSKIANRGDINLKYKIQHEFIGKGSSGIVSRGTDANGKEYAIKTINRLTLVFPESLVKEVEISLSLNHPHIIKYYEVYEDLKSVSVVMDLVEGGDLFDYILNQPDGKLSEENSLDMLIQILETLHYLHEEKKIAHRDIKPENFLVSEKEGKGYIKLIDFGFADYIKEGGKFKDYLGTPAYQAPEIINKEPYDEKVDIWSTGVLFFNMLTGCQPFNSNDYIPIEEQITDKSIPFDAIENDRLRELCVSLLERDPGVRYSAKRALATAYEIRDELKNKK